jgi:multiple antibiotic resistance protein
MIDLSLIIQIFVLLNPLSSFPFIIQAFEKKMDVRLIAIKSTLTAFVLAIIMALVGPSLFSIFGITLNSFRVAGGIILIVLAYNMVKPKPPEDKKKIETIDSLTTIIATPMLTGPGTISFITVKTLELGRTVVLSGILGSFILVGIVFFMFSMMVSKVSPKLVNILSRILGLFLMAVAVEMIAKGMQGIILAAL